MHHHAVQVILVVLGLASACDIEALNMQISSMHQSKKSMTTVPSTRMQAIMTPMYPGEHSSDSSLSNFGTTG